MTAQEEETVRKLLEFLGMYTRLLETQIDRVRDNMSETVSAVMQGINDINSVTSEKSYKAKEALVQDGAKDFKSTTFEELEKNDRINLSSSELKKLLSNNETFSQLDGQVQEVLFKMMGVLSNDDVVGQRIEHVKDAIHGLSEGLGKIISAYSSNYNVSMLQGITDELKGKVYKSFTTEEEKMIFNKYFGNASGGV